ncbi:MAG: DUF192 domain-containing protein [Myxococcaceae bacterium]|nr:DUF192 domain-containing protein [Myxococcaceae bacterium]
MSRVSLAAALVVLGACTDAKGSPPPKPAAPPPPKVEAPKAPPITDPAEEKYVSPALPMGKVTLADAYGGKHVVEVEIAATRDSRTRGLMWRTQLENGKGMLFLFSRQQPLSFWMRNTLIPLDMIFIDQDLKVVGCVENAEPKTLSGRNPGKESQFVLEVPAGWCAKQGVGAGTAVKFDGAESLKVEP